MVPASNWLPNLFGLCVYSLLSIEGFMVIFNQYSIVSFSDWIQTQTFYTFWQVFFQNVVVFVMIFQTMLPRSKRNSVVTNATSIARNIKNLTTFEQNKLEKCIIPFWKQKLNVFIKLSIMIIEFWRLEFIKCKFLMKTSSHKWILWI